ncbi:MAG: hypothetical protein Solivirus4_6 [Solivirus sp.]|uniref:Uncharacterized protein n=1 Tax=Solivirus sp. TaxID=2487772 RepID=A0A3G5AFQ2_9VIRU|nr:MAG: hypothetical protein Solivirus4_6 [Solivirus sp.]
MGTNKRKKKIRYSEIRLAKFVALWLQKRSEIIDSYVATGRTMQSSERSGAETSKVISECCDSLCRIWNFARMYKLWEEGAIT